MEAEIRERRSQNPTDEELPRLEQQLRLLYLAADRLDDAVTAWNRSMSRSARAYKQLMFGLGVWLSPDEARRAPLRSAKVLRSLRDATTELAAGQQAGAAEPGVLRAGRAVRLVHRVSAQRVPAQAAGDSVRRGRELRRREEESPTATRPSCRARIRSSTPAARSSPSGKLPLDKRDLPQLSPRLFPGLSACTCPTTIAPGRYRLELTIEDLKASGKYQGRKFGEGMIEFTIRQ